MIPRLFPALLFLVNVALFAAPPGLRVEPRPEWVVESAPGETAPAETVSGGINYLLADQQWRVQPVDAYTRYAYKVVHSSGLQDAAEISVFYSPDYERIGFHHLRVRRGDETVDQLDPERFEVLREERDRSYGLYDGRLTAIIHLKDVRVGDVIDYAFTRHGQNPIFGDRFNRTFSSGWSVPLGRQVARVIVPAGRELFIRNHGPVVIGAESSADTPFGRVFTWNAASPETVKADKSTPSWYVDYPYVQLGDAADWREVVEWARPLYPLPEIRADGALGSAALDAELAGIRAASENPEARLLAALDFVQRDIRYLGYELGEGSHRPRPPAETLANRFGDCKDKALLFCALARGLGWAADPALVNTSQGPRLDTLLPTPTAFNHVIATVRHPDGRRLWFDATDGNLAGDLEQHASPDYGKALIVAAGQTGLTSMTVPEAALGRTRSHVELTSRGLDVPGEMSVVTTYLGERAAMMRGRLAETAQADIARDYLDYYSGAHPGITALKPMQVEDDTAANTIKITESYSIPKLWKPVEKDPKSLELEISPSLVGDLVEKPAAGTRHAPLGLRHPRDTEEEIVVNLHTEWEIEPFSRRVDNNAFTYEKAGRIASDKRRITLSYSYRSKRDNVPAAEFERYMADLDSINSTIGYVLTFTPPDPAADKAADTAAPAAPAADGVNHRTIVAMSLVVLAGVGAWFWLIRRGLSHEPPPLPRGSDDPVGLGGWLILPAIGLVLRPVLIIVLMAKNASGYFGEANWQAMVTPGSGSHSPALAGLVIIEAMGNTALFMLALITAWLFFNRRRETPACMIALLLGTLALVAGDGLLLHWIQGTAMALDDKFELWKLAGAAAVWVPYFLVSRRVKNTFVR